MEKIYEQRGGVWIGHSFGESFKASWPFGKLEIYTDKIILSVLGKKEEILLQDISIIKKRLYVPMFVWGIQIKRKNSEGRSFLFFWSFTVGNIIKTVQKLGISIE